MTPAQLVAAYVCCWLLAQAFIIALMPTAIDLFRARRGTSAWRMAPVWADRFTGAVLLVGAVVIEAGLIVLAVRFLVAFWGAAS